MNPVELLLLALVLATDASLYAFSYSLTLKRGRWGAAWRLATATGFFQAFMPAIGYVAGAGLVVLVTGVAPWVVCGIFCTLGVIAICRRSGGQVAQHLGIGALLLVALATSIDALAVGICFAMAGLSPEQMLHAAGGIGVVTLLAVLLSFYAARLFRRLPEKLLQVLSGIVLIVLGLSQIA